MSDDKTKQLEEARDKVLLHSIKCRDKAEADRDELLKHLKDAAKIIAYLCHRVMEVKR